MVGPEAAAAAAGDQRTSLLVKRVSKGEVRERAFRVLGLV